MQAAIYAACLSAFLFFGYDQGVFGGILQNKYFVDQFKDPDSTTIGITTASYCLGAFFGCVLNFFIGDILGRRRMIWLSMGLIIVGASLQASAYVLAHLIVGRVITGLGTGIDSSTVPMYQSELAKKEWRGRLISWEIFFIGICGQRACENRGIYADIPSRHRNRSILYVACHDMNVSPGNLLTMLFFIRLGRLRVLVRRKQCGLENTYRSPVDLCGHCHLHRLGSSGISPLASQERALEGGCRGAVRSLRSSRRRSIRGWRNGRDQCRSCG